jgi:hypothetical protein
MKRFFLRLPHGSRWSRFSVRAISRDTTPFAILLLLLLVTSNSGIASSRFTPIPIYSSSGTAQVAATADVNGDGKPDVITSNTNGKVTVLLGAGNGSFLPSKLIATVAGGAPSIAVGDFNHDGKTDLAVASSPSNSVEVYLGRGDGTFALPLKVSLGATPLRVVIGDVNGDGHSDLLVGSSGGFRVLLGNGNGTFRSAIRVVSSNGIDGVLLALGDINRDGHLDVVISNGQRGTDGVFLGMGNGRFQEQLNPISDIYSQSQLLLADLNGDGKLDLIIGEFGFENNPGANVTLFLGNGDGTFQTNSASLPPVGFGPASLVAMDLNGDGRLDLAVANAGSNSISVLLNKGGGKFATALNYSSGYLPSDLDTPLPGLLTSGDFNRDGRPDLALATANGVQPLINLGGGRFYAPPSIEVYDDPVSAAAVDLNSDRHADIALETGGDLYFHAFGSIYALFGDGTGQFGQVLVSHADDYLGAPIAGGDFNHDGQLDLGIPGLLGPSFYTYFNTGHNAFSVPTSFGLPNQISVMAAGDFNNDGYADIAMLNGNEVDIYLGKGNGSFTGPTTYKVGANPKAIVVKDVNRDGKRDLVVANNGSGDVSVLLGKGNGSFSPPKTFPAGAHPASIAIGDFNRDGTLDLAVGGDTMQILLGRGHGDFAGPISYSAGGRVSFVAQADLRGNGIGDLVVTHDSRFDSYHLGAITVLYGKGDGSFDAPTPYTAGVDPSWLAVGDFNEDGATDVAVVDSGSTALTLLLNQGGNHIALRSSATSVRAGQSVTFTATLRSSVAGAGTPTGTIAFKDGARGIGFLHLNHGQAVFTTVHLSQGTHVITASYWGDGHFNPHVSAAVSEKITP